jgi:N-acyl-D-amino-acid deacylase
MGLKDRGLIREGMAADLVVFDLATIRDTATFFEPHQYPEGIDYVFVNGVAVVVDGGQITGALPGRLITR